MANKKKSVIRPILGALAGGVGLGALLGSAFTGFGLVAGGATGLALREPERVKKTLKKTFSRKHLEKEGKHWKRVVSTSPGKETAPLIGGMVATGLAIPLAMTNPPLFGGIAIGSNLLGAFGFAKLSKKQRKR